MVLDPWLPIGFPLSASASVGRVVSSGGDWQIVEIAGGGRALLMRGHSLQTWLAEGLLAESDLLALRFGETELRAIESGASFMLAPTDLCRSPHNRNEAIAFATAMAETRKHDKAASLQDGLYVEKLSRILPTFGAGAVDRDDLVLGAWLTGGVRRSATFIPAIEGYLTWLAPEGIVEIVRAAGLQPLETMVLEIDGDAAAGPARRRGISEAAAPDRAALFTIPGRRQLETFFNEHVIDIVQNRALYRSLGIGNPPAILLEGPPGCGKTFAVNRLIDFLAWPRFSVDAASIASPYIHETSRRIGQLFQAAMESAPSVLVIDEMDAVLSERASDAARSHRVEEIAEFLRAIPDAVAGGVLVVGMTNRLDAIDPAILRRGRFDHIVKVDFADEAETLDLLRSLLAGIPMADGIELARYAADLAGRPLSDTAFVIREGARLAAKSRSDTIDDTHLRAALAALAASDRSKPRIGFV